MEKEKIKDCFLTLKEIEDIANERVKKSCPKDDIRSKFRYLREPLICRYIYYAVARAQSYSEKVPVNVYRDPHNKSMKTVYRERQHTAHTVQAIGAHVGFRHATVINGLKALDSLIFSKHPMATECYATITSKCYELLEQKKDINDISNLTKSLFIAGV